MRFNPSVATLAGSLNFNSGIKTILMAVVLLWCVGTDASAQSRLTDARLRIGMCDASAVVAIGTDRFLVANDEDNYLRTYRRDGGAEPEQGFDMNGFLQPDARKPETDIEAAAAIGNRVYWITSHGRNKDGEIRDSRYRFWATQWELNGNRVVLYTVGVPYGRLLDDMLRHPALAGYDLEAASQRAPKSPGGLNIEGLAATPQGQLLIGFRNPIPRGRALLVPLLNPVDVTKGSRASLGTPIQLDLGGRGIRDIEYVPEIQQYVLIGGDFNVGLPSALYLWSGNASDAPQEVPGISFGNLNPEGIAVFSDQSRRVMIVSDEGTKLVGGQECKLAEDPRQRSFHSAWVSF